MTGTPASIINAYIKQRHLAGFSSSTMWGIAWNEFYDKLNSYHVGHQLATNRLLSTNTDQSNCLLPTRMVESVYFWSAVKSKIIEES